MTSDHDVPLPRRSAAPVAAGIGRAAAAAASHEVRITGGFWGDAAAGQRDGTIAHIEHWLEKAGLARQLRPRGRRRACPTAGAVASSPTRRSTSSSRRWPGSSGATGTPTLDGALPAIVAPRRRGAGARRLPEHQLRAARSAARATATWSGATSSTASATCCRPPSRAARTRPDDDGLFEVAPCAPPTTCATTSGRTGSQSVCGHPEIEVGARRVRPGHRASRATSTQAALFVERRGHGTLADIEWGRSYFQDDVPVREADGAARARRAGAATWPPARSTSRSRPTTTSCSAASQRQWANTVARRTYLTGGMGSHHQDEAFGDDFELPPDRAYSETCAGVASIMFSWRLLLATGEPRYADLIERTLYNVVATSPAHDGHVVLLHQHAAPAWPGDVPAADEPCPARVVAARAMVRGVVLPAERRAHASPASPPTSRRPTTTASSCTSTRRRRSAPPCRTDGDRARRRDRLPARRGRAHPCGQSAASPGRSPCGCRRGAEGRDSSSGRSTATRSIRSRRPRRGRGEPRVPRRRRRRPATAGRAALHRPDPRIDAVRGCVAIERGPEVLCLESVDLSPGPVASRSTSARSRWTLRSSPATTAPRSWSGSASARDDVKDHGRTASRRNRPARPTTVDVPLIAYHDWANRGPSTMRVWLPTDAPDRT